MTVLPSFVEGEKTQIVGDRVSWRCGKKNIWHSITIQIVRFVLNPILIGLCIDTCKVGRGGRYFWRPVFECPIAFQESTRWPTWG